MFTALCLFSSNTKRLFLFEKRQVRSAEPIPTMTVVLNTSIEIDLKSRLHLVLRSIIADFRVSLGMGETKAPIDIGIIEKSEVSVHVKDSQTLA